MIAILVLNWNGWEDTIECLKSIHEMNFRDYFIVLGDNGSTNDSKKQISNFCSKENIELKYENLGHESIDEISSGDIVFYDLKINNGFAKGNNLMINYCRKFCPEYYFLLNNDTVVTPDFMSVLLDFKRVYSEYDVLSPLIKYYNNRNKIWNAGGKLFWGFVRYYYPNSLASDIKNAKYIKCSFITGCAMLFTEECLKKNGDLFSEKYFFGEDDFELALRFKREHIKQACALDSVIYHKVSSSSKEYADLDKIYIHYLNRYINLRQNLGWLSYNTWRIISNLHIRRILKNKFSKAEILFFLRNLNSESKSMNGVSKEYFEKKLKIK